MKAWPSPYRYLIVAAGLLALVTALFWIFGVAPLQRETARLQRQADQLQEKLRSQGWPLDSQRLRQLCTEKATELAQLNSVSQKVLRRTTAMFDEKIVALFGDHVTFRNMVSRLDYQEEYNRIYRHFRDRGVHLSSEVLNLGEYSEADYTYQLVLQLWTVELLGDLALKHHLKPVDTAQTQAAGDDSGRGEPVARISVLPMKAYVVEYSTQEPYMLEFPVSLSLRGTLQDVGNFLASLSQAGVFLPVSHLKMRKVVPPLNRLSQDLVEVDLECGSFYLLERIPSVVPAGEPSAAVVEGAAAE
jgi:Tfp pilus assembly protein PilO